jgi:hypothetical protein
MLGRIEKKLDGIHTKPSAMLKPNRESYVGRKVTFIDKNVQKFGIVLADKKGWYDIKIDEEFIDAEDPEDDRITLRPSGVIVDPTSTPSLPPASPKPKQKKKRVEISSDSDNSDMEKSDDDGAKKKSRKEKK